jgi:hypothetical protein
MVVNQSFSLFVFQPGQWRIALPECIRRALDSDVVDIEDGLQLCAVAVLFAFVAQHPVHIELYYISLAASFPCGENTDPDWRRV